MNLPNKLTMGRIFAVPVFVVLYIMEFYIPAFVVFILASVTDMLDGKIARRKVQQGKVIDVQVPYVEECHLTGQPDDGWQVKLMSRAAVESVATQVKSADSDIPVKITGQCSPVDEYETRPQTVGAEGLAEHHAIFKRQVGVRI